MLLAVNPLSPAHPYEPPIVLVGGAENVYLGKVTAIAKDTVTFTVTTILRGKPTTALVLKPDIEGGMAYPLQSEWLLASCSSGYTKDSVGMPMEGYCGWIPNPVVTEDGKPFIKTGPVSPAFGVTVDTAADGTKGLTLDHIKQMLKPLK
jgi:hypothetical protein